jgi:hypothetical protein
MPINWLTVGSLYGAAGVAFGAFGAHGLKSRGISDAKIASWGTASHYQVSSSSKIEENHNGQNKESEKRNTLSLLSPATGDIPTKMQQKRPPYHARGSAINPSNEKLQPSNPKENSINAQKPLD